MSLLFDESVDSLVWWIEEWSCGECGVYVGDAKDHYCVMVMEAEGNGMYSSIHDYWKKGGNP